MRCRESGTLHGRPRVSCRSHALEAGPVDSLPPPSRAREPAWLARVSSSACTGPLRAREGICNGSGTISLGNTAKWTFHELTTARLSLWRCPLLSLGPPGRRLRRLWQRRGICASRPATTDTPSRQLDDQRGARRHGHRQEHTHGPATCQGKPQIGAHACLTRRARVPRLQRIEQRLLPWRRRCPDRAARRPTDRAQAQLERRIATPTPQGEPPRCRILFLYGAPGRSGYASAPPRSPGANGASARRARSNVAHNAGPRRGHGPAPAARSSCWSTSNG
jgi:hypothetical protein